MPIVARVTQVKLVFCPSDGYVKQASFFFHFPFIAGADDAVVGEHALCQKDNKDNFPLQPFRLVDGAERHAIIIAAHRIAICFAEQSDL